jgi:hypothetical protein
MPRKYDVNVKGWSGAEREILRAREDRRLELIRLARASGVQGAHALRYLVKLLRHYQGEIEAPECPSALGMADARFVKGRARELTQDHGKAA